MRKIFGFILFAAAPVLLAGTASAELWNLDFDTGLDANGNEITFAGDTIFSDIYSDTNWQRYDGQGSVAPNAQGEMPFRTNPSDGGVPGSSSVNVNIDVWNGRGQHGFAVGFDSTNPDSRDNDLEDPFNSVDSSATNGYGNILIIQSHEASYTKDCGGGRLSDGNGICFSESYGHSKADDEAYGGDITFDFGEEVRLVKMNIFDIEESGGKVLFDVDGDGSFYGVNDVSVDIFETGDHGVGLLTFNDDIGINAHRMMVWLAGSGAVDNIMGDSTTTSSVSEPGVLALFGVGLMAMGLYRRRRGTLESPA